MSCIIRCSVCGFKFFNDKEEVTSPADVLRRYSFRCPSCMKRLSFNFRNIKIEVATNYEVNRRISINRDLRVKKSWKLSKAKV